MNYFSKEIVNNLLILVLLFICFAEAVEANSSQSLSIRKRRMRYFRSARCPEVKLVCPTQEEYFAVQSFLNAGSCRLPGLIENIAVKVCDIGAMDQCKEKWVDAHNNCTFSIAAIKERLDRAFHAACAMHDLCYSAFDTERSDCDIWFYRNMKLICDLLYPGFFKSLKRGACKVAAFGVYTAVAIAGRPYFNEGQEWAQVNCTAETSEVDPKVEGSGGNGGIGSGSMSGSGSGSGSAYVKYKNFPIAS